MQITRKSMLTGIVHTIDLNITEDQIKKYNDGMLIQDAFPNLTDSEREFIISGIVDTEWNEAFPDDEDETDEAAF